MIPDDIMRKYADLLSSLMPDGHCFTLMIFESEELVEKKSVQATWFNYISSAERSSMIQALEAVLTKWKQGN